MKFIANKEFKDTPIGRIPKEWEVRRLGDVITLRRKNVYENSKGLLIIPMELIPEEGIYCKYKVADKNDVIPPNFCQKGDILLPKITPSLENGKQGIVPDLPTGYAFATSEVFVISLSSIMNNLFLFYLIKLPKFRKVLINSMIGTTGRQRVPREVLLNLMVPIPQPLEQQNIAEILSTVDSAVEKVDEEISKIEQLKKGLMQELLTKGIGHKEFKDTPIGRIPKEWEISKIESLMTLKNGERPKISTNREIPIYGANGIMGYTEDFLVNNEFTIIIGRVGASGEVHIGKGKIWVSDNAIYSFSYKKEKIYPPFIYYMLKLKNLKQFAVKTTHPIITQTFLNSIYVPCPTLSEQQRIAEILSTVDELLDLKKRKKEKLQKLKKGLMDLLLTGKIRVIA